MTDFLLELRSEEIPARMQARARNELARRFAECTSEAGLATGTIEAFSTPRRLVLIARDVAEQAEAVRQELKGPRTSAPPQALEGFLRKTGLTQNQLEDRDGVYFAVVDRPGRPAAEVLAEIVKRTIADFSWPKSMRWGPESAKDSSLRWVRPLHGIVAMLGEDIVPVEIDGIASGATTLGHRFHHPGPITVGGASDYVEKLRACHVVVDQDEREKLIREGAQAAAKEAGLSLLCDEGLVVENAGLTEWPVPLLGEFDADYLDVPREVIVLTMRTNQKYFACTASDGGLAPAFVCVANVDASDGGAAIVEGNRRVLAARLADARFFWEQDVKVPLESQAKKLSGIVFHEKLGTVADKVDRVAKLARWLVEEEIVSPSPTLAGKGQRRTAAQGEGAPTTRSSPSPQPLSRPKGGEGLGLADLAQRAARLAKADLVTGMVGEFPELQGVIGGYLAAAQGEPQAVADAIRDHYKPVGQGDEVPTAPVAVALALADKLDSIVSFFALRMAPTGSKDPYGLRRAAIGSLETALRNLDRFPIDAIVSENLQIWIDKLGYDAHPLMKALTGADMSKGQHDPEYVLSGEYDRDIETGVRVCSSFVQSFFADRLKVQQRDAGVRHDLIDAVFALGGEDDLVRLLARVNALQKFVETEDGTNLLVAYKRAANILKKEKWEGEQRDSRVRGNDELPEEQALIDALDAAEPKASAAIEAEDFTSAMSALASLRRPIDAFFDHVTVNDPDPGKRARRLNLLMRFRDAVNRVADFSKIEG